jgi:hypothetical protein
MLNQMAPQRPPYILLLCQDVRLRKGYNLIEDYYVIAAQYLMHDSIVVVASCIAVNSAVNISMFLEYLSIVAEEASFVPTDLDLLSVAESI